MRASDSALEKLAQASQLFIAAFSIAAAVVAYRAYEGEQRNQRMEYTFDLILQYLNQDIVESQIILLRRIKSHQITLGPDIRLGSDQLRAIFSEVSAPKEDEDALDSALLKISFFFDHVDACIAQALCDGKLAKSLLLNDATGIDCVFGDRLRKISDQSNLPNIGAGIFNLSNKDCGNS